MSNQTIRDYCYNYGDSWRIVKSGEHYGNYNSYDDAKRVSDKLKDKGWKKSELKKIQQSLGINPRTKHGRGTSGYFGVYKCYNDQYSQGFTWIYQYYDKCTGKKKHISSVDIDLLEKKVKNKGLRWEKY